MSLNGATFLKNLEGVITGNGFKRVIQGINLNTLRTSGGLILTGSTAPLRASLETNFEGVQSASGTTDFGSLVFNVPRDYDVNNDELKIRFLCNSAGDTNTPTMDAAMFRKRAGVALTSDLDPTISAAMNNNTAKAGYIEIDASDLGCKPGDALHFDLTTSAHSTDAANFYGVEVVYRSDLVYFENTER
ncbi:hypothetical protein LCGC14_0936660 [marine sediment metagenome]|uniref:Uncharacterized protein n=1 Tax=marine sediment metagenome TaxID=412755 RepID=A0A0F9RSU8_9ZZZZ